MNIENLRKIFPQFKLTDATDRTPDQLARIQRISGNINNATYNINLSNLLPKDVEYWRVQMYLTTNIGWYIDVINNIFI
jgi:hypothetical protein